MLNSLAKVQEKWLLQNVYRIFIDNRGVPLYNLTQLDIRGGKKTVATREQIEQVAATLRQLRPAPFFKVLNESQMGIGAVVRYLKETEGEVNAGNIAAFMGVSTARVAVLLKKMAAKGLIVKETAASDGRVTIVRLSETGMQTAAAMEESVCRKIGQVIDRLGVDRMLDFLAMVRDITELAGEDPPDLEGFL